VSTYSKPHLTYQQQLALIKSRGTACPDDAGAIRLLEAIGYYNLTGYLYPYRRPAPSSKGRLDVFRPGTDLRDVETLIEYDRQLRNCLLDGARLIEVAARARVAYVLGQRDLFAHVAMKCLGKMACGRRFARGKRTDTAFNWWLAKYNSLQERAQKEPFVGHNLTKYGQPLAIWIACELFDFGAVTDIYELMPYSDRKAWAAGLSAERTMRTWLRSMNHVRNACAHNKRLWNRVLTVKPALQARDLPADWQDKAYPGEAELAAYPAANDLDGLRIDLPGLSARDVPGR
jgi:abortive infection bacteriophage resistance protein